MITLLLNIFKQQPVYLKEAENSTFTLTCQVKFLLSVTEATVETNTAYYTFTVSSELHVFRFIHIVFTYPGTGDGN